MPGLARLDAPGVLHHIIIRGIEPREIFRDDKDNLIDRLSVLLPETKTACYAWAFLSNHAHFFASKWQSRDSNFNAKVAHGVCHLF